MFSSKKKYDIVSVGSATSDIYIESGDFKLVNDNSFISGKGICFNVGSKLYIDSLHTTTGGGALNTAITFANQGLSVGLASKIGADDSGEAVRRRLKNNDISDEFLVEDKNSSTTMSILLHSKDGDRTILNNKGASARLSLEEINIKKLTEKTRWVYITHISEESGNFFEELISEAERRGVKIAINPGSTQLKKGKDIAPFFKKCDILILNKEEASILTGVGYDKEEEIVSSLRELSGRVVVMTKGKKGVVVLEGDRAFKAGILKENVFVDRTGAGDAFGSGFVSSIVNHGSIEDAILLGSSNATAVLREWGANRGLMKQGELTSMFGALDIKKIN